jgi:putative ABC transport system permease protein
MNAGYPRVGYFFADARHRLRSPLVPTLVAILVLFSGTTAIFATTGLAVASQQRTLARINSPEGRLITITDPQGSAGLSPGSVEAIRSMSGVEWAIGIGPAIDVTNTAIPSGQNVPARLVYGSLVPPIQTDRNASLSPGQAIAGAGLAQELGLSDGVGSVHSRTQDAIVVGGFTAHAPLTDLNRDLLIAPSSDDPGRLLTLWVSVRDVAHLAAVTEAVTSALEVENPGAIRVETSKELARLSQDVVAGLADSARMTISGLLLAVAILVGALQYGRVAGMARDIGRCRALGATRSTIVLQVLINAGLCGLIGATLGSVVGLVIDAVVAGQVPGVEFTTAVGILMVLAALLGSVAPAIRAARLDPVRILRVP